MNKHRQFVVDIKALRASLGDLAGKYLTFRLAHEESSILHVFVFEKNDFLAKIAKYAKISRKPASLSMSPLADGKTVSRKTQ